MLVQAMLNTAVGTGSYCYRRLCMAMGVLIHRALVWTANAVALGPMLPTATSTTVPSLVGV